MTPQHRETTVVELGAGAAFRLLTLMTHYRQPLNYTHAKMEEAVKILSRWGRVAEPCEDGPPLEVLEALTDDLNTPKAIAAMHRYRANGEGRKLYAAMRFLGIYDAGVCFPSEVKTLPDDHIAGHDQGPDTIGLAQ